MSDLRAELTAAIDCLQFVIEDDNHDESCPWCTFSDYASAFDGAAGVEQTVGLLRRAIEALDAADHQRTAALLALEHYGSLTEAVAALRGGQR